jgi:hypothetical protein
MPYFNKGNDWSAKFMAKSPFKQGFFKRLKEEGVKSAIKGSLPARAGGVLKDEYGRMFKSMGKKIRGK